MRGLWVRLPPLALRNKLPMCNYLIILHGLQGICTVFLDSAIARAWGSGFGREFSRTARCAEAGSPLRRLIQEESRVCWEKLGLLRLTFIDVRCENFVTFRPWFVLRRPVGIADNDLRFRSADCGYDRHSLDVIPSFSFLRAVMSEQRILGGAERSRIHRST